MSTQTIENNGTQSPQPPQVEAQNVAHHGAPILTQRDAELLQRYNQWITTVQTSGMTNGTHRYSPDWMPSSVDIVKSRLFWRLRAGKDPLPAPPPTSFSCPWYEVVEETDRPHWCYTDVHVAEDDSDWVGKIFVCQCPYDLVSMGPDGVTQEGLCKFGLWHFKLLRGTQDVPCLLTGADGKIMRDPETGQALTGMTTLHGWFIQRIPEEITDQDRENLDYCLGIDRAIEPTRWPARNMMQAEVRTQYHESVKRLERELLLRSIGCGFQGTSERFMATDAGMRFAGLTDEQIAERKHGRGGPV